MMCTLLLSSPLFFIPDSAANPLDEKSPFSKEETCSLRTLISVEWIINKTNGNIKITWTYHLTISFLCLGSHILLLLIQWAEAGEPQTQQHWLTCWVGAFFSLHARGAGGLCATWLSSSCANKGRGQGVKFIFSYYSVLFVLQVHIYMTHMSVGRFSIHVAPLRCIEARCLSCSPWCHSDFFFSGMHSAANFHHFPFMYTL